MRHHRWVATKTPLDHELGLTPQARREIFNRVLKALDSKFYKPELLGHEWQGTVAKHRYVIENAQSSEHFEREVTELLQTLKTSHLGFFHGTAKRASSRAALSATYLSDDTSNGTRWIFQDVHEGGAAALGGIEAGNILLRVDGKEIIPPEHPVFPMGSTSSLDIVANDGQEQTISVTVARPKGKKLQFVEPTLVQARRLAEGLGYLKVAMFPGMIGVDVANAMSQAISELGAVHRLIVDLRGNTGGGAGALRLMSLLTPYRLPAGYAADRQWAKRDLSSLKSGFPRLGKIPATKGALWFLGLRFLPALISKSPVVLESEGLGSKPYDGKIVLLVNRHTASAAEMVTIFAKENHVAKIVGENTAGRLLSATSVKVGHGFRLALPTGAYYTWKGTALEGSPLEPDESIPFSWQERRTGIDGQLNRAIELAKQLDG
jgi:carboxyl-terminal processing protease